jgi:hypothetical protein
MEGAMRWRPLEWAVAALVAVALTATVADTVADNDAERAIAAAPGAAISLPHCETNMLT